MANISLVMLGGVNLNNNINPDILQLNGKDIWSAGNYSRGLEYTYSGDYATLAGIGTCEDVDIIVPEKVNYNGKSYSVAYIAGSAFYNVKFVNSIKLPNSLIKIGDSAFSYSSFKTIYFPENKIEIMQNAFYNCQYLKSVYIPTTNDWFKLSAITEYANPLCNGANLYIDGELLTDLEIPSDKTQVGDYKFQNCTSLQRVTIHENVTDIGYHAFYNCVNLKEIICYATTPPTLESFSALYNPNLERIYVPVESVDLYRNAEEWSVYADRIIPLANENEFNYVGLDINGNMEGQVAYDGTVVAYAIGKPNYEYYQQFLPTPTTLTDYYGKYIYAQPLVGEMTFIEITSSTASTYESQITVGETPCYLLVTTKEEADASEVSTFADCGGYSSEYYGGYDFQTPQDSISEFIVPEILVLPDTYKGKPVTRILKNAFRGNYSTESYVHKWQALNIKEIQFGENIKVLDTDSFYNLVNVSNSIVLPNSMKKIEGTAFHGCGTTSMQLEIPASVEEVTGSVCYFWGGSKLIFGNPTIIKGNFDCKAGTTIVLKETVKNITGDVFSGNYIPSVYVFEHPEDAEITLDITSLKSAKSITIYTDNTMVKNYDWAGKNITVTFRALSEYAG